MTALTERVRREWPSHAHDAIGGEAERVAQLKSTLSPAWQADDSTALGRPATIAYRVIARNPAHVVVVIFAGRTEGARGNAGQLTFRADEWDALRAGPLAAWEALTDLDGAA